MLVAARAPLVSILIRSMDRPTLRRALRSAAAQTWPNLEIVVVSACGAMHRDLPQRFEGRPLRLIRCVQKLTRPQAANAALEAAHGKWVNFLDDDDELLPHHIARLMNAPRAHNERVVFSATCVLAADGRVLGQVSHAGNHVQLFFHSRAATCAMLLQRRLIDDGARFDPEFAVHEDHDFQVNCASRTEFCFVEEVTCVWHAQAGESGCGFGANDDKPQRQRALRKVRLKWAECFSRWLADADALLFTGQQYLKGRDYPSALECLERALALRPGDINAQNLCGMANYNCGHVERAEQLLAHALRQLPGHCALQENLALIRRKRSDVGSRT